MKSVAVIVWLLLSVLADALGSLLSSVRGFTDWSLVGWAFAGSTAYVLYEIVKDVKRSGKQRAALITLGFIVSLTFNKLASDKSGFPIEMCTSALGMVAYKLFSLGQRKVDKAKDIEDLTN